jgi:hypothetical protein
VIGNRSYIVHIYRRISLRRVIGAVDVVRTGQWIRFGTAGELWAIVNGPQHASKRTAAFIKSLIQEE